MLMSKSYLKIQVEKRLCIINFFGVRCIRRPQKWISISLAMCVLVKFHFVHNIFNHKISSSYRHTSGDRVMRGAMLFVVNFLRTWTVRLVKCSFLSCHGMYVCVRIKIQTNKFEMFHIVKPKVILYSFIYML